jgi:stage II sporulation protein D
LSDPDTRRVFYKGENSVVGFSRGKVITSEGRAFVRPRFLAAANSGELTMNGRVYRGSILAASSSGGVKAINYLELEEYIRGISIREISHYWPAEVLRAQAVVFRTYAVYCMRQYSRRDYDVSADTSSQVYGGKRAERYRITDAINRTKGEILTFGGDVLAAFFHSTCGGATAPATQVTNKDIPGIGTVVCGYCRRSPYWKWELSLKKSAVQDALTKKGFAAHGLRDVRVVSADNHGRAVSVGVLTSSGEIIVKARDFRAALGFDRFRSTVFLVRSSGDRLLFSGRGWGHGTGLCQWGAYFMAREGFSYKEILAHYYPGSEISVMK